MNTLFWLQSAAMAMLLTVLMHMILDHDAAQVWEAVVGVVVLAPGWVAARRMTRQMALLRQGIDVLAVHPHAAPLPENGCIHELNRIAQDVNRMARALAAGIHPLMRGAVSVRYCADGLRDSQEQLLRDMVIGQENMEHIRSENQTVMVIIEGIGAAFQGSHTHLQGFSQAAQGLSGKVGEIAQFTEDASQSVCTITTETEMMNMNFDAVRDALRDVEEQVAHVNHSVNQMNGHLLEARSLCQQARGQSKDSAQRAVDATQAMEQFADAARRIGKIVRVINDIADQTNMLSLNAAIEAAGAGSAGMGFAVVAKEVKELAGQTAEATHTIRDSIQALEEASGRAVGAVRDIVSSIDGIAHSIHAIDEQADRQAEVGEEITRAMEAVSRSTLQVTGLSDELRGSSGEVFRSASQASDQTKAVAVVAAAVAEEARHLEEEALAMGEISGHVLIVEETIELATRHIQERIDDASRNMARSHATIHHVACVIGELERTIRALGREEEVLRQRWGEGTHGPLAAELSTEHLRWMEALIRHVRGDLVLERAQVVDDDHCQVGRWLATRLHDTPHQDLHPLKELHARLHRMGGEIMDRADQDRCQDIPGCLGEMNALRQELLDAMTRLLEHCDAPLVEASARP
ncbi:MAG: hypothetical protein HQL51_01310 [Magnetococcales bacterium]|nr:hypothetical protein [Magnetococcales bacterium]